MRRASVRNGLLRQAKSWLRLTARQSEARPSPTPEPRTIHCGPCACGHPDVRVTGTGITDGLVGWAMAQAWMVHNATPPHREWEARMGGAGRAAR